MSNHLIEKNLNRFHLSTYSVDSYSLITNGRFHYTLFSALTDSITPVILFVTVGLGVGRYSLVSERGSGISIINTEQIHLVQYILIRSKLNQIPSLCLLIDKLGICIGIRYIP